MPNNFTKYIKAVGTGKKHNHDLTQKEMCDAMNMILNKEIFPEQLSAFLLGSRLKPETTDEFKGVLDSFDNFIKRTKIENSIELGYPYDGKRNNPYLFSLIAKILKPYDINIVVTGDDLQPAKKGITVKQIINGSSLLAEININEMFLFSSQNFLIGQSIVIEFNIPLQFIINATIFYCRSYNMKSRIISNNPLPYRVGVKFALTKQGERTLLREFLQSIEPDLEQFNQHAPPQGNDDDDDDDDDILEQEDTK